MVFGFSKSRAARGAGAGAEGDRGDGAGGRFKTLEQRVRNQAGAAMRLAGLNRSQFIPRLRQELERFDPGPRSLYSCIECAETAPPRHLRPLCDRSCTGSGRLLTLVPALGPHDRRGPADHVEAV